MFPASIAVALLLALAATVLIVGTKLMRPERKRRRVGCPTASTADAQSYSGPADGPADDRSGSNFGGGGKFGGAGATSAWTAVAADDAFSGAADAGGDGDD